MHTNRQHFTKNPLFFYDKTLAIISLFIPSFLFWCLCQNWRDFGTMFFDAVAKGYFGLTNVDLITSFTCIAINHTSFFLVQLKLCLWENRSCLSMLSLPVLAIHSKTNLFKINRFLWSSVGHLQGFSSIWQGFSSKLQIE